MALRYAPMDTPRSMNVSPAPTPVEIDKASLLALFAILVGWFFMDTLVVSLGSLQHGMRFFDVAAAIADPTRIFFGVEASFQRIAFGLICIACLLIPVLPHRERFRPAWLAYLAPLALMVVCGALLYSKTSSEFFSAPGDPASLTGNVIRFANHLVRQGTGLVSRHVSIGAGGYLAFAGCLVLAAQGLRQFRRHV